MGSPLQLIGKVFGRLTVKERGGKVRNHYTWVCSCECGNTSVVEGRSLVAGTTNSCGCLQKESARGNKNNETHGLSKHPLYGTYNDIKKRCYNKNCPAYLNYGGRGIKMSDEWLNSFKQFLADVGNRPNENFTLDRKDNEGDYCKDNIRWVGPDLQARNQRMYSNNTSGKTGVNLMNRNSNHPSWMGRVSNPETEEEFNKSFSINKYGNDEAYRLACEWRDKMLEKVNKDFEAGYTESHGK